MFLLFLLALLPNFVFGQADFRKGFIVTINQDTIHGLVKYTESIRPFEVCQFRSSDSQEVSSFDASQLTAYGFIDDKSFESKQITENDVRRTVFFQVLVKGFVSLYKYKRTYWVEKQNQELKPLIDEVTEAFIDGKRVFRHSNSHIVTLKTMLFDCPSLRVKLGKEIDLDARTLTELIVAYNSCLSYPSHIFGEKKPWVKLHLSIAIGIAYSAISFNTKPDQSFYYLNGDFDTPLMPVAGFSTDILSPRINERLALHIETLLGRSHFYRYVKQVQGSSIQRNYTTLKYSYVKIPIGVRYTFAEKNFTPFVTVGVSTSFNINSSSLLVRESETAGFIETYKGHAIEYKETQFGILGGIGVLKKISDKYDGLLEVRYESTNGVSDNRHFVLPESKLINVFFVLGVRLR